MCKSDILRIFGASTVIAVLALFSAAAQDFDLDDRYRSHLSFLTADSLHGRATATVYEKAVAGYMWEQFSKAGLEMLSSSEGDVFGIERDSVMLRSVNVAGVVQGYDPQLRNRYIVIGAHMDNRSDNVVTVDGEERIQIFPGADDNASGLAMLAELARLASENDFMFRRSLVFVAFGASEMMHSGAWYFLNRSFADSSSIDMMINLDMVGRDPSGFCAYTASDADMNALVRVVSDGVRPVRPKLVHQDFYPGDHRVFLNKGIHSVLFTTGFNPDYKTVRDSYDRIDFSSMSDITDYVYNFMIEASGTRLEEAPASAPGIDESDVYSPYECDKMPSFFNGSTVSKFLTEWVYVYQRYPQEAVDQGIQGTVTVSFIVEKNGEVTNVKVTKGVHPLLDEEAVRVIKVSPKWKPGVVAGERVRVRISVPVEFILTRVR